MSIPFFYVREASSAPGTLVLDEENSRHAVQVLRMKPGSPLRLTDGRGQLLTGEILLAHKKHCEVKVLACSFSPLPSRQVCLGVSLLKNPQRFEWFLEKATELGVSEIIPLLCERTEKERFRLDRMQAICISAMLQSQQSRLPLLQEPVPFRKALEFTGADGCFIAHCGEDAEKKPLLSIPITGSSVLLIGPEGDFTPGEISLARDKGYMAVSLGKNRLRTETAAMAGAVLLTQGL